MTGPIYGGIPGDIAESKQDVGELNLMTLIGCTDERGDAWHRREDLQGAEDNHYPGFIPIPDVLRRLFHWHPRRATVAYLIPCGAEDADMIDSTGQPVRVVESQQARKGVLRDDNDYDLGVFRSGAVHPPYQVTLLEQAERLTGTTLGVSTAGCLQKGARAWLEFSMPETLHDPKSGFSYRPNLLKADSMDGSISLTTALTIEATVCMNTLTWNLLEAREAGRLFRRKHTRGIVGGDLQDERDALGVLERVDAEFTSELHTLLEQPVSDKQVIAVLDIIRPLPEEEGRAYTLAENFRDQWMTVYREDPMAAPWKGTALGVFQTDNTVRHWYDQRRGGDRWETNTWRTLLGKTAQEDRAIVRALEEALA